MKHRGNKRFKVIILGFFLLVLIVVSQLFSSPDGYSRLGAIFNDSLNTVVYYVFDVPINSIASTIDKYLSLKYVYEENQALKALMEDYASKIVENDVFAKENQELKELAGLVDLATENQLQTGRIISRSLDGWQNTVTINLGTENNIIKGMAVISSSKVMIGVVSRVGNLTSEIQLLTSENRSTDVSIMLVHDDNTASYGILTGYSVDKGAYVIDIIESSLTLTEGMKVVTSGYGGVIPRGLLIGEVVEVVTNSHESLPTLLVKPTVKFKDLHYIAVVKSGRGDDYE